MSTAKSLTQREAVWLACEGRCVACGRRWGRGPSSLHGWHAHHVIKASVLRSRHVPSRYVRGPDLCVLLCAQPCHERHTTRFATVPFERLPAYVAESAASLGPWAWDLLLREHPPKGTT